MKNKKERRKFSQGNYYRLQRIYWSQQSGERQELTYMKEKVKRLYWRVAATQLEAVGVVEIILILVIIIGLVLIFRHQIVQIISNAFASINENSSSVSADISLVPTQAPSKH